MKTPSSARGWCLRDPEGKLLVGCCSSQPWDLTPRHDFGDDDTWVRTQVPVRITEIGEGYVEGEACGNCGRRIEYEEYTGGQVYHCGKDDSSSPPRSVRDWSVSQVAAMYWNLQWYLWAKAHYVEPWGWCPEWRGEGES